MAGAGMTLAVPAAIADTVTVGSTTLESATPSLDDFGQGVPVFQGQSSGHYTLSSPVAGTITSWSFRSGGSAPGKTFALRVLRPAGGNWTAVSTSGPVAIPAGASGDALIGPFNTNLPVQSGDRIGLQAVDGTAVPIEQGTNGTDGVRYFSSAPADGSITKAPPIVIVSSTRDPATPSIRGKQLQAKIRGSVVLTWDAADHTAYGRRSPCLDAPVTKYLIDLTVPRDGLACRPATDG